MNEEQSAAAPQGTGAAVPEEIWAKVSWLFALLPGFLCVFLATQIANVSPGDEFTTTYYGLICSIVIYTVVYLIQSILVYCFNLINLTKLRLLFILLTLVMSVLSGVLLAYAIENDWLYRTVRSAPLSPWFNKRSDTRPLVFLLKQNTQGQLKSEGDARPPKFKQTEAWVQIATSNRKIYEGWPEYYEISAADSDIYLSPACRSDGTPGSTLVPIDGPGVLIFEREIVSVTFLDRASSPCFQQWKKLDGG